MSEAPAYLLILLVLMSHSSASQTSQLPSMKIGFSCCHFYDLDSGSPVFMYGEEIWVQTEENISVVLRNPTRDVTTRAIPAHSSIQLYLFKPDDPAGQWQLEAHSEAGNVLVPIHLVNPLASAMTTQIDYGFNITQLIIKGTLTMNATNQGGFILLTRQNQNTSFETPPTPFRWGNIEAALSWDPSNPRILNVASYAPALTTPNVTIAWAEISQGISLLKQVGKNQVFTLVPQIVARTNRVPINLQANPKEIFTIDLPRFHEVGTNGQAPLRPGPIHIALFIESEKTIYVLESDAFLFSTGIVSSLADIVEVPPLLSTLVFELRDNLQKLSNYSLVLVAKETGVSTVWRQPITPPVSRFQVLNTLDSQLLEDYRIQSEQMREITKIGNQTFAIPTDVHSNAKLSLSIGGIQLQANEFEPGSIVPEPLSTFTIRTAASEVLLRLEDALGSAPTSGTLKLTRITGRNEPASTEKTWDTQGGVINLTVPLGRYEIEFGIESATVKREFSASHSNEFVNLTLTELTLIQTRNSLILTGAVSVIVVFEVVIAFRIWKSLSGGRKNRQREFVEGNRGDERAESKHDVGLFVSHGY